MSERTVDYETHVDLIAEHAATEYRLRLTQMAVQSLEIDAGTLRDDLCETIGSLAEANSACDRRDMEIEDLQEGMKAAESVAKELGESNKRLLERAEMAERRLRQVQSGETDEEVAMLRSQLDAASRKLEDQEELLSHAATQADELRTRAQKAEAELATVKPKLQRALAELATERKRAESLEAEVETSEAEFTALKEGPCDASA